MQSRPVQTFYGPAPGCPDCGIVVVNGPHLCEHGVTPALKVELEASIEIRSRELYDKLLYGEDKP